jgi:hypothetical protein
MTTVISDLACPVALPAPRPAARHDSSDAVDAAAGRPMTSTSMTPSPSGAEGDGFSAPGPESCPSITRAARRRVDRT